MNDTNTTTKVDNLHFPQPGHDLPQPKRRAQRHQPVKIYTLGTSSHSSPHLVYSPSPMTAPALPTINTNGNSSNKSYNNLVGRSRSASHSVLPLRPRADSTAVRMAMEAMVQAKLDRITLRLDEFNYQSHDLYARTQALAIEFQAKAKRLYQVEDHLLRVQGKPGLSEHYLDSGGMGKKPRRLTNDLEELSLGVKTLRNRFQVAGTVATTVGWLTQLKEKKARPDGSLSNAPDHGHPDPEDSTVDEEAERAALGPIVTSLTSVSFDSTPSIDQDPHDTLASGGLRSPPLTPRGPISRSSILNKGGLSADDRVHLSSSSSSSNRGMNHNSKARPLSIIPDLEEPPLHISTINTIPTAEAPSHRPLEAVSDQNETRPSIPTAAFAPPSPASPVEAWTGFRGQEQEEQGYAARAMTDSASAAASSEPKSVTGLENDATQRELEAQREHEEYEGTQDPLAQLEPDYQQQQQSIDISSTLSDEEEETWSEVDQTLEQLTPKAALTSKAMQDELMTSSTREALTDRVETADDAPSLADVDASADDDAATSDDTEGSWIQFFWKLLVRAEYFFLGTAVLGAMMPDNLLAFCAGFLSAIVYGILLIRHRITAAPGTEAPQPPTGGRDKASRKRTVKDRVRSRSYGAGSSSGFRESSTSVSRRTVES
ncbi:hypothetical protein BGZ72_008164 [Mortierella alpina]|nr:hypothetical protein BGZ72_008164 [Mortierella alpina]